MLRSTIRKLPRQLNTRVRVNVYRPLTVISVKRLQSSLATNEHEQEDYHQHQATHQQPSVTYNTNNNDSIPLNGKVISNRIVT